MNWSQIHTILWLRSRLAVNQWMRGSGINTAVAALIGTFLVGLAIASFAGGLLLGGKLLPMMPYPFAMYFWDVVIGLLLFTWLIGIATELQRSEIIDLPRLMHLPVLLWQAFAMNYLASLFSISLIICVPTVAGVILSLAFTKGAFFLLIALPCFSFIFLLTAWTYCLRGWLATLMTNQRRRRTIVVGVTVTVMLISQLPNILINSGITRFDDKKKPSFRSAEIVALHRYVPPLWVGYSAAALQKGRLLPTFASTAGFTLLGVLGLVVAYRATLRYYRGQGTSKAIKPKEATTRTAGPPSRFLEGRLPGIPDPASALALAFFRSALRAPELKMALGSTLMIMVIFGSIFLTRTHMKAAQAQEFAPIATISVVIFALFGMSQLFLNQFGFDRDGFRALVLSPVERRYILLGKNLALAPFVFVMGLIVLIPAGIFLKLTPIAYCAALLQMLSCHLVVCILGNSASVLTPYRVAPGTLKPSKTSPMTTITIFVETLILMVALAPVALPAFLESTLKSEIPVNLLGSVGMTAILAAIYAGVVGEQGRMLERREKSILETLTREVE